MRSPRTRAEALYMTKSGTPRSLSTAAKSAAVVAASPVKRSSMLRVIVPIIGGDEAGGFWKRITLKAVFFPTLVGKILPW